MLTKEDLLTCDRAPNIRDISLALYKDFAEEYLMNKVFHYTFTDGTELNIEFTEWGIYHMLSIQHIDGKIGGDRFFEKIKNGLCFDDFKKTDAMKERFKKQKKRITLFACVYKCLCEGKVFYIPSGKVGGTASVNMDYIVFRELNNISPSGNSKNGLNVGIRRENGIFVPLTILKSNNSDVEQYIKNEELKIVRTFEINSK